MENRVRFTKDEKGNLVVERKDEAPVVMGIGELFDYLFSLKHQDKLTEIVLQLEDQAILFQKLDLPEEKKAEDKQNG